MEEYKIKNWRFTVEIERSTSGKFRYFVKSNADTIDEMESNIRELLKRIDKTLEERKI